MPDGDPYRSASAPPCPRCSLFLVEDGDGDLVCADGCGRWIPATSLVTLLGTANLGTFHATIAFWKATPFPPTACPVCQAKLVEKYMPLPDDSILSHGFCVAHGAWLDHGTHADFAAAYGKPIAVHREAPPEIPDRVAVLEQRIAKLERQLQEVRDYVGNRFRWFDWKEK